MKIRLSRRATREVERIDARWRKERPAAPLLFVDELSEALDLLEASPEIGVRYGSRDNELIRRILLERSKYFVYYAMVETDEIEIVTIWGTQPGRGPRFGRPQ